jgi:hypothetical protein
MNDLAVALYVFARNAASAEQPFDDSREFKPASTAVGHTANGYIAITPSAEIRIKINSDLH